MDPVLVVEEAVPFDVGEGDGVGGGMGANDLACEDVRFSQESCARKVNQCWLAGREEDVPRRRSVFPDPRLPSTSEIFPTGKSTVTSWSSNWFAGVAVPAAGVFLTSILAGQVTVAERKATS